ncbi:hydrogenase formation protein HypD [Corynebacterium poyangense]|uniref:Hydrogenase formation protein HypD n=1 Tax=Corynebacterium poyangense TaxID=2684405 RepID=A0A7H0SR64_9CORY|nr:hydrogenase formation protein HypD [Corynebacterium poyangense]MBZ8176466.1 hydrogenase formation protein HypD [Corynebacterium poyangense]QNQ91039.1 hydrogenase formation protein HypD [Corynebacterium poyangense]
MKYVDEFRDPDAARALITKINHDAAQLDRPIALMEICGGHTHTIYRYGLENLLPENIELVHGPGCPVCVIPMGRIDDAVWLAQQDNVTFTTFGDMMRVPGSEQSLLDARADGADVQFVYSPLDALRIAEENPQREVVFFAVGFETTAPSTAATLVAARNRGITNFSVFSNHVFTEPPLRAIVDEGRTRIDGFIGPGHVSAVTGAHSFQFLASDYNRPVAVCGFEPLDILQGVAMLLSQFLSDAPARVDNQYARVVTPDGNLVAQKLMNQAFQVRDSFEWRGLGWLPHSGMAVSQEFADWDAEKRFTVPGQRVADPVACECGSVLTGRIKPWQCRVFGTACTPATPIGTCMVSPEGACAAYYNFGRLDREATHNLTRQ